MYGIPKIPNIKLDNIVTSVLGQIEAALWDILSLQPKWGIYSNGLIAVEVDSVIDMGVRGTAHVADYRLMTGAFTSYNKVVMPRGYKLTLAVGGGQIEREIFLKWLDDNCQSATVVDVVMPEKVYESVTLTEYNLRREASKGTASRVIAECLFIEIREVPVTYYKDGEEQADTQNAENPADMPMTPTSYVDNVIYNAKNAAESVLNKVTDTVDKLTDLKNKLSDTAGLVTSGKDIINGVKNG